MELPKKNINGFCYLDDKVVIFVDLLTEKKFRYSLSEFGSFIKENDINNTCIFLANREDGVITPLYKYSLTVKNKKTGETKDIIAKDRHVDQLINVCYKICIKLYSIPKSF